MGIRRVELHQSSTHPSTHRAITPTATGNGLTVSVERASSDPPEPLPCACVLLATGSDRKAHAMAQALGHSITPPVPSLFTFELGKGGGSTNPLQGLAGISVGMVEVRLLGPAGGVGGAKALKEVRGGGLLFVCGSSLYTHQMTDILSLFTSSPNPITIDA